MNHKISDYLTKFSFNIKLLVFVLVISVVFVYVYTPFESTTWFQNHADALNLVYASIAVASGLLILIVSRIVLCVVGKKEPPTVFTYIVWMLGEVVLIAIAYSIYAKFIMGDERLFNEIVQRSLLIVPAILAIPYVVSYLYLALNEKSRKLNDLLHNADFKSHKNEAITEVFNFCDENGKLKLSISLSDVFYLVAANNYVYIYYYNGTEIAHFLLRGNLSDFESQLSSKRFSRSHRSYIVNLQRVQMISKEKDGLVIIFDQEGVSRVPVSKTYASQIVDEFASNN